MINEIPNHCVRVKGLNEKCLKENHAKYHAKCSLNFNNSNYVVAQNRFIKKRKSARLILEENEY